MAKSVNKVILIGSAGKDPEIKTTGGGTQIASFSLATNDRKKEGSEWVDTTEWHNLKAFGKTAEIIGEYVKKGSRLYIEGKITTNSWEDKQSGEKKYRTEIIVNELVLLSGGGGEGNGGSNGNRSSSGNSRQQSSRPAAAPVAAGNNDFSDEDIPF